MVFGRLKGDCEMYGRIQSTSSIQKDAENQIFSSLVGSKYFKNTDTSVKGGSNMLAASYSKRF